VENADYCRVLSVESPGMKRGGHLGWAVECRARGKESRVEDHTGSGCLSVSPALGGQGGLRGFSRG
jgi:hypothetical protein